MNLSRTWMFYGLSLLGLSSTLSQATCTQLQSVALWNGLQTQADVVLSTRLRLLDFPNKTRTFQIDTGAHNLLYGPSWFEKHPKRTTIPTTMTSTAPTDFQYDIKQTFTWTFEYDTSLKRHRTAFRLFAGFKDSFETDGDSSGTLGIDFFKGHIAQFNLKKHQLCLFTPLDMPSKTPIQWMPIRVRANGKVYIVLTLDRGMSHEFLIDSGAGLHDINAGSAELFTELTGKQADDEALPHLTVNGWGKPIKIVAASLLPNKVKLINGRSNIPIHFKTVGLAVNQNHNIIPLQALAREQVVWLDTKRQRMGFSPH